MFNSMILKRVPEIWTKVAYPSLKPLGSWFTDLLARIVFFKESLYTIFVCHGRMSPQFQSEDSLRVGHIAHPRSGTPTARDTVCGGVFLSQEGYGEILWVILTWFFHHN